MKEQRAKTDTLSIRIRPEHSLRWKEYFKARGMKISDGVEEAIELYIAAFPLRGIEKQRYEMAVSYNKAVEEAEAAAALGNVEKMQRIVEAYNKRQAKRKQERDAAKENERVYKKLNAMFCQPLLDEIYEPDADQDPDEAAETGGREDEV